MNPTEVWASDVTYLEGGVPKRTISHRRLHQLKPPIIGIDAKLERSLRERLGESRRVLPWKLLLLDAEDALSRGDTRLSVILGQTAIEGAISELLIRKLLEKRPPLDEVRDKLRVRTNRDSNRAGNIGRVLKGWVPAGKTTYGYRYQKEIDPSSGAMLRAWWDIDQVDPEGNILYGSEAWVVVRIYHWIGVENQSPHWVAKELNRLGIKPRYADDWSPSLIVFLVRKRCYTGNHAYNTVHYVTNPERPLGDITGEIKRTIRKP